MSSNVKWLAGYTPKYQYTSQEVEFLRQLKRTGLSGWTYSGLVTLPENVYKTVKAAWVDIEKEPHLYPNLKDDSTSFMEHVKAALAIQ